MHRKFRSGNSGFLFVPVGALPEKGCPTSLAEVSLAPCLAVSRYTHHAAEDATVKFLLTKDPLLLLGPSRLPNRLDDGGFRPFYCLLDWNEFAGLGISSDFRWLPFWHSGVLLSGCGACPICSAAFPADGAFEDIAPHPIR